jgi:hypothetical protein
MNQWLPIILTAIVVSLLGYLLNQLPAIPSFPNRGRWIAGAVVLVIALSVLLAEHPPIPHAPLLIGAVGFITVTVLLILIWLARRTSNQALPDGSVSDVRSRLLRRLENDIHQRRASALHHLIKIDLQLEDQPQQVGQPDLSLVPEDSLLNRSLRVFKQNTPTAPLESTHENH